MLTTGIQNLPEPLARAQAAYHDGTARLAPASADRLARRVEHFASSVQFVLDGPDAGFTPHREIAAAAGFRAVQSTPLVDYAGHLIGMVSMHFQRPQRPSDRDLRIMELYADFAGEALTRHLGLVSGGDPPDPLGRAMVSALLDPARVPGSRRVGPVRVVGHGPDDRELRPPGRPTRAERSARLTGLRSRP
jgi:GAF domain